MMPCFLGDSPPPVSALTVGTGCLFMGAISTFPHGGGVTLVKCVKTHCSYQYTSWENEVEMERGKEMACS